MFQLGGNKFHIGNTSAVIQFSHAIAKKKKSTWQIFAINEIFLHLPIQAKPRDLMFQSDDIKFQIGKISFLYLQS